MADLDPIHYAAQQGDLKSLSSLVTAGTPIDLPDKQDGLTPLMHACQSTSADAEVVQWLIKNGADVNAMTSPRPNPLKEPDGSLVDEIPRAKGIVDAITSGGLQNLEMDLHSVLMLATKAASVEKIRLLIEHGANLAARSSSGYTPVIHAGCADNGDALRLLVESGAPIDGETTYGESALSTLSNAGNFDLIGFLLSHGADPAPLQWNPLMKAVALGSLSDVKDALPGNLDLEATDRWGRTAFLLAVVAGDVEKAGLLKGEGAEIKAAGHCGCSALAYAAQLDHSEICQWLLAEGLDPDLSDSFGSTPLHEAVEHGSIASMKILLEAGADPGHKDNIGYALIEKASHPDVITTLLADGADPSQLEDEVLRDFIGIGTALHPEATASQYKVSRSRRFGKTNPERMNYPFWDAMVRCGWNAYQADLYYGGADGNSDGPTWCHDRFGMSLTCLPDGRFVQVAGEHEDSYDPDFCIYNEVFVHDGHGGLEIFGYPREIFPPTDFHSATLMEAWIYLIGNLGYAEDRGSQAQVFRLCTNTWRIERVETTGDDPGWISDHRAELQGGRIRISGGQIWSPSEGGGHLGPNTATWDLDVHKRFWQLVAP